ncbi:hypothetical protein MJO29_012968 [Puccinia striiformis f. sp. tritici]|nr:hypothetical protein MJO29_012968 [Puccinia striiformis f. sp. tritici]
MIPSPSKFITAEALVVSPLTEARSCPGGQSSPSYSQLG